MASCPCIGCLGGVNYPVVNGVEFQCPCAEPTCNDIFRAAQAAAQAAHPNDPDWWMYVDYSCQTCTGAFLAFTQPTPPLPGPPCPNCSSTECWDGTCCCVCGLGCPGQPGPQPPVSGPACPWCSSPLPDWDPVHGWCWWCGYPWSFCACWGCTSLNCQCVTCDSYNEFCNAFGVSLCCAACASATYDCSLELGFQPAMMGG